MTRWKLMLATTAVALTATSARADGCSGRTIDQIITACDAAFDGGGVLFMSARGWCYMINAAQCALP
jgi:hypothetical protein